MSKVLMIASVALTAAFCVAATDDLSVARQALRDGLWDVARLHAAKDGSDDAKLVMLECLAGEGKWTEVERLVKVWADVRGDGFDYYRALVSGDRAAAMEILRRGGSREGCVEADLYYASELAKSGARAEAERIWRGLTAQSNVSARVFVLASAELADEALLRQACLRADTAALRRLSGLRLGVCLLRAEKTAEEGRRLVRSTVADSPDTPGAREALLLLADDALAHGLWKRALDTYRESVDVWPETAKLPSLQEGRGWALQNLGRMDEALEAFRRAGKLAGDDEIKARMLVKEGDLLQAEGLRDESLACYRKVLADYPQSKVAASLADVVRVCELEAKGRSHYKAYLFAEAAAAFAEVAKTDPKRRPMMDYFGVLCLYGQGRDDEACARARQIVSGGEDSCARLAAMLWLAKFLYNRREWDESARLFVRRAESAPDDADSAEALLWAARAAFAGGDFNRAIQLSTQVVEKYPDSKAKPEALLVQGEALVELARYAEAVLVLERVPAGAAIAAATRVRAATLRADALYAMGADNSSRYAAALEAYRAIRFGSSLTTSDQIVISAKIARALEKLKRMDEAMDVYYAQVVLAYRDARLASVRMTDAAQAAFSRAALRLSEVFESRGRERQAVNILRLVEASDVPASAEAAKRIRKLHNKGSVL